MPISPKGKLILLQFREETILNHTVTVICDFLQTIPSHRCKYKKRSISDVASDSKDRRVHKKCLQKCVALT